MTKTRQEQLFFIFSIFPKISSISTIAIGSAVLLGWILNIPALKSVLPGLVSMKVNTALCFTLLGFALFTFQTKRSNITTHAIALSLIFIVLAIATLTFLEYRLNINIGIDQILFKDDPNAILTTHAGRMAINTTISFILASIALIFLSTENKYSYYITQLFATLGLIISMTALTGYLYGVKFLYYGLQGATAMALHTAIAFSLIFIGIFFSKSDKGLANIFSSANTGGLIARYLIPIALVIPTVLGWLETFTHKTSTINHEFGITLITTANTALMSCFILWLIVLINRMDAERQKAENEKTKTQLLLIQSEKISSMSILSAGISHELNSPLMGLLNLLEAYHKKAQEGSEEKQETMQMLRAVNHMVEIIRSLNLFARESKNNPTEKLDINEIIKNTVLFTGPLLTNNNIKIITNFYNKLLPISGEKIKLQQAIINIMLNAKDAMPKGGNFTITTSNEIDNKSIEIKFEDNGMGIKREDMDKLFTPFFTTKKMDKGIGLGLPVVYGIVKEHSGTIHIDSEINKGTLITIRLPYTK